jgi:DNA-binding transcriptional regulator/RsmH inhibitor MraZ
MIDDLQRHKGFHPYKMDAKFRVSVPSAWRPKGGGPLHLLFSKAHGMPVVKVLGQAAIEERVRLVRGSGKPPAEQTALLGRLAMLCREAALNDQGKLLVPKDLSEKAGIRAEGPVVLAGRGIHFEIWSGPNFETLLEIETRQEAEDELGIF